MTGEIDRSGDTVDGVTEVEVQDGFDVFTALRAGAAASATVAEESAENIAEVTKVRLGLAPGGATEAGCGRSQATNLVIFLALGGVTEHVVGDRDGFELLFTPGVGVGVVRLG